MFLWWTNQLFTQLHFYEPIFFFKKKNAQDLEWCFITMIFPIIPLSQINRSLKKNPVFATLEEAQALQPETVWDWCSGCRLWATVPGGDTSGNTLSGETHPLNSPSQLEHVQQGTREGKLLEERNANSCVSHQSAVFIYLTTKVCVYLFLWLSLPAESGTKWRLFSRPCLGSSSCQSSRLLVSFQRSLCVRKRVRDWLPVCKGAGGTIGFVPGALAITAAPEDALYKSQCPWLLYSIFTLLCSCFGRPY